MVVEVVRRSESVVYGPWPWPSPASSPWARLLLPRSEARKLFTAVWASVGAAVEEPAALLFEVSSALRAVIEEENIKIG
jgi:hypothetical protein